MLKNCPSNNILREKLFNARKSYKKSARSKKDKFIEKINQDIESDNKNILWENMKKLTKRTKESDKLDAYDMYNFIAFFKQLYSKQARIENQEGLGIKNSVTMDLDASLNAEITLEELDNCIKRLKARKAVAEDKIANEFLKNSTHETKQAVLKVFSDCLNHGVYPWNTALVTPILKKGSIYDPNNYRTVAVDSKIGKLFSSIFLDMLLSFRKECCKDPINQLGLCKEAQTADHILTLGTCIQKYVKKSRKRLYTCFVDF